MAGGIFPDWGLNLFPALAGRFFTSESPGKPFSQFLKLYLVAGAGSLHHLLSSVWIFNLCDYSVYFKTALKETESEVTQLCPTLCNPMACSPPESSVDGIFQASILDWVAISYSSTSSRSRDWTCFSYISCIGRQILYLRTTWEWCDKVIHFDSFPNSCPIFPAASTEETVFSPLYILASFVVDCLTMYVWVCSWAFYFDSLYYASVIVLVPCCFIIVSL